LGQEARRFAEDNAKWGSEVPWRDGQQALHAAEVMLIVARRAGSLRSLNAPHPDRDRAGGWSPMFMQRG